MLWEEIKILLVSYCIVNSGFIERYIYFEMVEVYYDVLWFYWGCIGWVDGGFRLSVMILWFYYNMYMYVKLLFGIYNEIIKFFSGYFLWIVNLLEFFIYNGY